MVKVAVSPQQAGLPKISRRESENTFARNGFADHHFFSSLLSMLDYRDLDHGLCGN
jgi:hypothetical protein